MDSKIQNKMSARKSSVGYQSSNYIQCSNIQNLHEQQRNINLGPIATETLSHMPVYHKVLEHFKKVAVTDADGDFLYEDIFRRSSRLAKEIISLLKGAKFDQKICVVCPNGVGFVVAQWATWMSGNIVVPLRSDLSPSALEYFIKDCKGTLLIGTKATEDKLNLLTKQVDIPLLILDKTYTSDPVSEFEDELHVNSFDQFFYAERHTALLLYTAGATGPPKGLLYRHYNLNAQADGIVQVWNLDKKSSLLNALPMNHTYGIVSSLLAPMSVGGRVVMMDKFDSVRVWAYLLGVAYNGQKEMFPRTTIDVLPSTPAQYQKLCQRYHDLFKDTKSKDYAYNKCKGRVRLMLSSNETMPPGLVDKWQKMTGHSILQCLGKPEATGCQPSYVRLQKMSQRTSVC
jgi:malonyl-CoA/methylmalonyl-CoA synthetase